MRDGGYLNLYYFDPATDYVTNLQGWLHSLQVVAPWAASGYTPQDGEALTAWLYDDMGTLLASTGDDRDESPNAYWFDDFGVYDIQPGYWVTVTGGSGWSAGVQVPAMTIQGDHESDLVSGEAPKGLLYLNGRRSDSSFRFWTPVDGYALDTGWFGHDGLHDQINATYQALDGSQVRAYTQSLPVTSAAPYLLKSRQKEVLAWN